MVTHKASDKLMVSVDREDDWMRVKKKYETELKDVEFNQVGLRIQKGGSKLKKRKDEANKVGLKIQKGGQNLERGERLKVVKGIDEMTKK